jgi:hypothetical protein
MAIHTENQTYKSAYIYFFFGVHFWRYISPAKQLHFSLNFLFLFIWRNFARKKKGCRRRPRRPSTAPKTCNLRNWTLRSTTGLLSSKKSHVLKISTSFWQKMLFCRISTSLWPKWWWSQSIPRAYDQNALAPSSFWS